MGLMDDIEAAAARRDANEPGGTRLRRRIGAAVAAFGVLLCLAATVKTNWRVMDFHVVGYFEGDDTQLRVGVWKAEVCPDQGDCEELSRREFLRVASPLSTAEESELETWLDQRARAGYALLAAALAGAVLVGFSVAPMRRRRTRTVAFAAGVVATIAAILVWRALFAEPVAFMSLATGGFFALAGVGDLLLGVALVGISREHDPPELARAVARTRPGD